MAPSLPEDLYHLIKKAVSVRKHLERNRKVFLCTEFMMDEIWETILHIMINKIIIDYVFYYTVFKNYVLG